jgi:peroxiredoxin
MQSIEGYEKLNFLCDGNREFLKVSRLPEPDRDVFLGGKFPRFYVYCKDNKITKIRIEDTVFSTELTNGLFISKDVYKLLD